jgi:hypothetical protein
MTADYLERGITSVTPKLGLPIVGPNCMDSRGVLGQVHNALALQIEAKLTEMETVIATLQARIAELEKK